MSLRTLAAAHATAQLFPTCAHGAVSLAREAPALVSDPQERIMRGDVAAFKL
jgi:hypothetical protein